MEFDIEVGTGDDARRIAVRARPGAAPPVVWLGGFRSEMSGTKADALDAWATETGQAFVRFDYSGHGVSGGRFEDGTIGRWLDESLAILRHVAIRPAILVGSSMGGWLALLAALAFRASDPARAPVGLVLLAPATDFTERLMWDAFPEEVRRTILGDGTWHRPSAYSAEPYPVTRALIEEGRRHLILGGTIALGCPVHILQGMKDPDVPWEHAMRLAECLPGDGLKITTIPDGDHRLSRPEDLHRLRAAVASAVAAVS